MGSVKALDTISVAVFGCSAVGLASAAVMAGFGHRVTLVAADLGQAVQINNGLLPVGDEPGLSRILAQACQAGRLAATTDPELAVTGADVSLICASDLRPMCRVVGSALGACTAFHSVVLRTPIWAGVTDQVLRPVLQLSSGLRASGGGGSGSWGDFGLALWPAFVRDGHVLEDIDSHAPCPVAFGDARTARLLHRLAPEDALIPRPFAEVEELCDRALPALRNGHLPAPELFRQL